MSYPISEAVAASAAVPVVFAPIVLETFPGRCQTKLPDWIARARADRNAQPLLRDFAQAIDSYHTGGVRYVKLLDGGLVDNFGLSGFTIALLSATRPYEPLTPQQAARIRRVIFLIVDSGRGPSGDWSQQLPGPTGVDLVMATADTATEASTRASYTAFVSIMNDWAARVRRWRCGLSAAERERLGVACQLALQRHERVCRAGRLRPVRPCARRCTQCNPDAVPTAAAVGRSADRCGRGGGPQQPDLPGVPPRALVQARAPLANRDCVNASTANEASRYLPVAPKA